jgi:hypothetical protein
MWIRNGWQVIGNSGGGTQSAYLAALDSRLAVAAPSCYITSWKQLWFAPGPQDAEQDFAGFIKDGLDFPDFLVSFAPRPIRMLTAIRDFFPIEGARATFAEASREFNLIGAEDRVSFFEYDDTHGWSKPRREATAVWLERWLHDRKVDGAEPEFQTIPPADLRCTTTGQVASSLGGETVRSMNRALAEKLFAGRKALHMSPLSSAGWWPIVCSCPRCGARRRQRMPALWQGQDTGLKRSRLTASPASRFRRSCSYLKRLRAVRVLFFCWIREGKERQPGKRKSWCARERWCWRRICGDGARAHRQRGRAAMRASGRVECVRCWWAGTYRACRPTTHCAPSITLAARRDVDRNQISVQGSGDGALIAVLAGAVEPRLRVSPENGTVPSYLDSARAEMHSGLVNRIIPGVLADFDIPDLEALLKGRK